MFTENKISSIVRFQLPEHIRDEFPQFVLLLEYYYEFLEQDSNALEIIQNAKKYQDIDQTANSFVQYFLKNYAYDITPNALLDKQILVKKIKSLYESKGSVPSFQLLFKILYNDDIEIKYPYENVLKPSDGIWDQKFSIHILRDFGDDSVFLNRECEYIKNDIKYKFVVSRAKRLDNDYTELLLELKWNVIPFAIGDKISVYDGVNKIYSGSIVPTTTKYQIINAGFGFKKGQIVSINLGSAVNTLVKIADVNPADGSITALTFINYGWGYQTSFIIELWNNLNFAVRSSLLVSGTNGFDENVYIEKYGDENAPTKYFESDYVRTYRPEAVLPYVNPHEGSDSYFESNTYTTFNLVYIEHLQNYVADEIEIFEYFFPSPGGDGESELPADVAIIQFDLGTKARYPGQYISYKGFPSEFDVRLQDDKLYQPFAYQIQTNIDISVFYNAVKNTVHQAGTNLFANRTLQNIIDLGSEVEVGLSTAINLEIHDTIRTDDIFGKSLNAELIDSFDVFDETYKSISTINQSDVSTNDFASNEFNKNELDVIAIEDLNDLETQTINENQVDLEENITLQYNLNLFDNVSIEDVFNTDQESEEFYSNVTFEDNLTISKLYYIEDDVNVYDENNQLVNSDNNENLQTEELLYINFNKSLDDNLETESLSSFEFYKNIIDSVSAVDNLNAVENQIEQSDIDIEDAVILEFNSFEMDSVDSSDERIFSVEKSENEVVQTAEIFYIQNYKNITDSVSVFDNLNAVENQIEQSDIDIEDTVVLEFNSSINDLVESSDERIFSVEKSENEIAETESLSSFEFYKNIIDSVSAVDNLNAVENQIEQSDIDIEDAVILEFNSSINDLTSTSDNQTFEIEKSLKDETSATEIVYIQNYKNIVDSVSIFDNFDAVENQIEQSNVSANDNTTIVSYIYLTDNVDAIDLISANVSISINDIASINDENNNIINIIVTDNIVLEDSANAVINSQENIIVSEDVQTSDDIEAYLNDYVSEDYFEELYVGRLVA